MTITNDLVQPNGQAFNLVRGVISAYTAKPGDLVAVNTSAGSSVITLPSTPAAGDAVAVGDDSGDATNAIVVFPPTGTIDGAATYTLQRANDVEIFLYDGSQWRRVVCTRTVFDPIRKIVVPRVDLATLQGDTTITTLTLSDVSPDPSSGTVLFARSGVPLARASASGAIARLDGLDRGFSMIQRCTSGTLPDTGAGSQTSGALFRMQAVKAILGIRFFWPFFTATPSYTIKCSIWNNSTTALLATVDVAVQYPGAYEGIFATPITADLTGVDIAAGLWEKSGTRYPRFAADASFENSMPIRLNSAIRVVNTRKFSAGDARPTTDAATERYGLLEPILAA